MIEFRRNHNLQPLNTLALPAKAEYYCRINHCEQLQLAVDFATERGLPITVLGGGSNVVFAGNIAGLVIHIGLDGIELHAQQDDQVQVDVAAGENWHQLVEHALEKGWYGLENLSLIPGLAGAAPIQNIGAYGVELKDIFHSLQAFDIASGKEVTLSARDCEFGYRDSIFKRQLKDQLIITRLRLNLSTRPNLRLDYPALRDAISALPESVALTPAVVAETVCRVRRSKLPQPSETPNAGSFFKNPVVSARKAEELRKLFPGIVCYPHGEQEQKLAAGWLVEQCGWRGKQVGNVGVHHKQALVLVNNGGTGEELLTLAEQISESVKNRFGVKLEIEPRVYR